MHLSLKSLAVSTLIALAALLPTAAATAQEPAPRTVRVTLVSETNGKPINQARLVFQPKTDDARPGRAPLSIDGLEFARELILSHPGMKCYQGWTVLTVLPGTYTASASAPGHLPASRVVRVPEGGRGEVGQTINLKPVADTTPRIVVITVRAPRITGAERGQVAPLAGAGVTVKLGNQNPLAARTDASGQATFRVADAVIGDSVQIKVSARGYASQQRSAILGSMQSNNVPSRATNVTATDQVVVTLQKELAAPSLVVEVVRADNGKPVPGATVKVVPLRGGGRTLAATTDGQGKTRPFALESGTAKEIHTSYRVEVSKADELKPKFSDIPAELLTPGAQRTYVVHADATNKFELEGLWRRNDGHEVRFAKAGDNFTGTIAKLVPGQERYGFRVGEVTFKLKAVDARTLTGEILFKSTNGTQEWRANTVQFQTANSIRELTGNWTRVGEPGTLLGVPLPDPK